MKLSFKDWWDSLTGVRGKIRDEDEDDAYFIALAAWNAALAQQAQPLTDAEINIEAFARYPERDLPEHIWSRHDFTQGTKWARDRSAHAAPSHEQRDKVFRILQDANHAGHCASYVRDAVLALYNTGKPETP